MTQPNLTIIGSYTSPFARIARVACEELKLPYKLEVTGFFATSTPEQATMVENNNPLMRIPVLLDDEETILDSRVIVTYLARRYGNGSAFANSLPQTPAQENIITVTNGALDAAILRVILKNTQPNISLDEGYAARSLTRVQHSLAWLDTHWQPNEQFGIAEALLICALEWLQKRTILDCIGYHTLQDILRRHSDRDSLLKTRIPEGA